MALPGRRKRKPCRSTPLPPSSKRPPQPSSNRRADSESAACAAASPKIRAGQSGRAIFDEAREIHAQAIVLPLPPRTGTTIFGKTVETVLAERPCRVIIESEPAHA